MQILRDIMPKMLEFFYTLMGLIVLYTAIVNLKDKTNSKRITTALFWGIFGIDLAFGKYLPSQIVGITVLIMALIPVFGGVKIGKNTEYSKEYSKIQADKFGNKIFIPALVIGLGAVSFAILKLNAIVGVSVGVILSVIILMVMNKDNTPKVFLDDSKKLLDTVGSLSLLPILLAILGAIFNEAKVGEAVSSLVVSVIPQGNLVLGIIVYAIGMTLFTMIMGNAFAAITVMTTGIAAPFVFEYGGNPILIGMLGLTCGYCGTLLTPMAANFNIVPVALLEMKDKNGVIKKQIIPSLLILIFQICMMIFIGMK